MKRLALLCLLAAGCLEVPNGPSQECVSERDCDSGEVCSEGLCWGNPPPGTFTATLSAPSTREDLVATELVDLVVPADGWLGDVPLEAPVTISGRVEAYCASANATCTTASIGAEVRLTRPARFPGGPALRFTARSKSDVPRGADSFELRVPRTQPGDPPWTMTIDPEGGGDIPSPDGTTSPAELVPPRRLMVDAATSLEHQTYTLGGPDPTQITGMLRDALGNPLSKYRVVALGRWSGESTPTEVSSVAFTTNGVYSIAVADGVLPPLEIVATPYDPGEIAPALHLGGVQVYSQQRNLNQPPGVGQRVDVTLPIEALAGNGEVKPVNGARVIVTGAVEPTYSGGARAVFTTEATTTEDGLAHLSLLDGPALASSYLLRAVPPASSSYGVVYDAPLLLDAPAAVRLPARIALRGTVVDIDGAPLASVSVTARRSLRFLWSVAETDQPFLDEIPAASAITTDAGEFVVWVDPAVAETWGHYDLFFETPAGSTAPNWSITDLEMPRVRDQSTFSLDTITLPDSARIHGRIVDGDGRAVEGSALRVFQLVSNADLCAQVSHAPQECSPTASVLGHGESDEKGQVRVTLPRP